MKVTFRTENGCCPYFIWQDTMFYIQDRTDFKGHYTYALYCKSTEPEKVMEFSNKEEVRKYIQSNQLRIAYSSGERCLYRDRLREYIVEGTTVIVKLKPKMLSDEFPKYLDCLEYAKQYVADYIGRQKPEQMLLFSEITA